MATSLSIKGKTQANDGVTSTINYVNPNATDAQLVSLATAMNNLTTNTVTDVTRIDKNSLINTIEKLPRNVRLFQLDGTTPITEIKASEVSTSISNPTYVVIKYNSDDFANDVASYVVTNATDNVRVYILLTKSNLPDEPDLWLMLASQVTPPEAITLTFSIAETSTYQAATFTIPITL